MVEKRYAENMWMRERHQLLVLLQLLTGNFMYFMFVSGVKDVS